VGEGIAKTANFAHGKIVTATSGMGFKVENVLVEGRKYADAAAIRQLVGVEYGAPLFSFDPSGVRESLEKIEWVKRAEVGRRLPDTIYIRIEEHTPLALWQKDKALHLIDEEGNIINTAQLGRFRNLMIIMGEGAPQNAPDLLTAINSEPALHKNVTSAKWMDGRRWDLDLKQGISVKLPESETRVALTRLAHEIDTNKILEKDITVIDLRNPERMIVRTRPGAVKEYKAALKEGDEI
jgi:cell division protein FtsQ